MTRVRAAAGGHAQLTLRREIDVLDGIAFGRGDLVGTVHEGDRVDVAAHLVSRRFGGFESLQLGVIDVAEARTAAPEPDATAAGGHRGWLSDDPSPGSHAAQNAVGWGSVWPGSVKPFVAPLLSMAGLLVVAVVTVFALTGQAPFLGTPGGGSGGNQPPGRTPSPSAPPDVNPAIQVQGSLVYVKAGNLWIQTGNTARQLTRTAATRSRRGAGRKLGLLHRDTRDDRPIPGRGGPQAVRPQVPDPDAHPSGRVRTRGGPLGPVQDRAGEGYTWFWFILDPAVSPDGTRLAVGVRRARPDPERRRPPVRRPQDEAACARRVGGGPSRSATRTAWRPDGRASCTSSTRGNGTAARRRSGATTDDEEDLSVHLGRVHGAGLVAGRPVRRRRAHDLARHGCRHPRRRRVRNSPRVTTDGRVGPTWSPDGKQLAFLRLSGVTVDLQLATLQRASNGDVSVVKTDPLTTFSSLDCDSRPAWWGLRADTGSVAVSHADGLAVAVMTGYLAALAARSASVGTCCARASTSTPDAVPAGFPPGLAGAQRFARLIVEATAPFAAAMKPNLAFFEAYGSPGLAALERVRAAIPVGIPVIADAKRGDVETTVARQAVALFDGLGVDAVTASPYLGLRALEPFLAGAARFIYVLCRTSNPAAGELAGPHRGGGCGA